MGVDSRQEQVSAPISPVEGVPYQDCWVNRRGTSLRQQVKDYAKTFAPWGEKVDIRLDPQRAIEILNKTDEALTQAGSIADLQEQLIVLNANEFRLRDKPTDDEFEAILADFKKWHLRVQPRHFLGGSKARDGVAKKVNQVIDHARTRFSAVANVT